jgi:hypothetical protein
MSEHRWAMAAAVTIAVALASSFALFALIYFPLETGNTITKTFTSTSTTTSYATTSIEVPFTTTSTLISTTTYTTTYTSSTVHCGLPGALPCDAGDFFLSLAALEIAGDNGTLRIGIQNTGSQPITRLTVYLNDTIVEPTPMNISLLQREKVTLVFPISNNTVILQAGKLYHVLVTSRGGGGGQAREITIMASEATATVTERQKLAE